MALLQETMLLDVWVATTSPFTSILFLSPQLWVAHDKDRLASVEQVIFQLAYIYW